MPQKIALTLLLTLFFLLAMSYARPKDTFISYKAEPKIKAAQPLKYFQKIDDLIKQALLKDLSPKEKSFLRAMSWLNRFVDEESHFKELFPYYLLLMHEVSFSEEREHQKTIARLSARMSLERAQSQLKEIYSLDEKGRWHLIGALHILPLYPEFRTHFIEYYRENYSGFPETYTHANGISFEQAVQDRDHQISGDYLIDTSFLHYYLKKTHDQEVWWPKDLFPDYLTAFEKFDYDLSYNVDSENFLNLGFLATHVILVLTNYGEFAIEESLNQAKAQAYIEATFDKVRFQVGNLDLLAEYGQCLKILTRGDEPRIDELEKLIFGLQHKDGSWGSAEDFSSDAYNAFHPTWAVLTALNYPKKGDTD